MPCALIWHTANIYFFKKFLHVRRFEMRRKKIITLPCVKKHDKFTTLSCVKIKHMTKHGFAVCYISLSCVHTTNRFFAVCSIKYRTHGKESDSGSEWKRFHSNTNLKFISIARILQTKPSPVQVVYCFFWTNLPDQMYVPLASITMWQAHKLTSVMKQGSKTHTSYHTLVQQFVQCTKYRRQNYKALSK